MRAVIEAGYPYELAGLVFYVFFLYMTRKRVGFRYEQRTRVLTLVAAIALVSVVPLHYARNAAAVSVVLLVGLAAIVSAFIDARSGRR